MGGNKEDSCSHHYPQLQHHCRSCAAAIAQLFHCTINSLSLDTSICHGITHTHSPRRFERNCIPRISILYFKYFMVKCVITFIHTIFQIFHGKMYYYTSISFYEAELEKAGLERPKLVSIFQYLQIDGSQIIDGYNSKSQCIVTLMMQVIMLNIILDLISTNLIMDVDMVPTKMIYCY